MVSTTPVLIIEDDEALREGLRDLLLYDGHDVVEAGDGLAALRYLDDSRGSCGLILLDIGLPTMTGWEFLARIRSERILRDIPVIVISAIPTTNVRGALPVFQKPVNPDALLDAVRTHVR
jgi:DNA-binding response OmpR family regulator